MLAYIQCSDTTLTWYAFANAAIFVELGLHSTPPSAQMHGSRHETPVTSLSNSYSNQTPKASSREDSRRIARVHFKQLSEFLETHLRKGEIK